MSTGFALKEPSGEENQRPEDVAARSKGEISIARESKSPIAVESSKPKRILYIDILRILAIAAVLIGHAAANDVADIAGGKVDTSRWWTANIIDSSIRWCIPVFFMISGILLLDAAKNESYGAFLKKRFLRIGIPFVIWSIFYSFAKHLILEPDGVDIKSMPLTALKDILTNNVYYHMWFMYTIMGIYLFVPVIRAALRKFNMGEVRLLVFLWIIVSIIIPTIQSAYGLIKGEELNIQLFVSPYLTGYLGYCILGYYLNSIEIGKTARAAFYVGSIAGFVSIPILIYISNISTDTLDENFYSYFNIPAFLFAIGVFLFIRQIDWEKKLGNKAKKAVTVLSEASFGIYLVHLFIEDKWISRIGILKYMPVGVKILIIFSGTSIISFLFVRLISSKKKLSRILLG
ncbi:MAG: acyltransferase family protein [Bacillota bacterium]|nr:acyltransferase family protein [Bacillota bacterium]